MQEIQGTIDTLCSQTLRGTTVFMFNLSIGVFHDGYDDGTNFYQAVFYVEPEEKDESGNPRLSTLNMQMGIFLTAGTKVVVTIQSDDPIPLSCDKSGNPVKVIAIRPQNPPGPPKV